MKSFLLAIRPNNWLKNLLVFIPVIASHQLLVFQSWRSSSIAFVAISLAASSGYIFNDIGDLESDRKHPIKKNRPLASGALSLGAGLVLGILLIFISLGITDVFQKQNLYLIVIYFVSTILYSFILKKIIFIDILTLIGFYLLRILIGANAIGVQVSLWLYILGFAFFSSLALLKRHSELNDEYKKTRKAYSLDDRRWLEITGITCALLIPVIFGLYVQLSPEARLYRHPIALIFASPVFVYWLLSGWRRSLSHQLKEDLILYAFKEKSSYVCLVIVAALIGISL